MNWDELNRHKEEKGVDDNCYIELVLEDGRILQGKYSAMGVQGGVNLYTAKDGWHHYGCELVSAVTKLPVRRNDISRDLEETMKECEEWDFKN